MQEVARGKNEKCCICLKKFSIFTVEHICKRCLRSVCKSCADNKANIFEKGGERKPHRLCTKCLPETQFLENYKTCYKITFNTGCKMGNSWADELAKNYTKRKDAVGKIKKTSLKPKAEFWSDLNFSLRNFFGVCVDTSDYYPVLKSLYERCQITNLSEHVCMFFLCHCNEQKAQESIYAIYSILENQPPDLDRIFANLKFFGCSQKEMTKMRPFVDSIFSKFVNSLSLNMVTAEVSLFIISAFIRQKTTKVLEKGLATALFILKDFICTYIDNRKALENEFVLNIRFNQFESNMKIMTQKQKLQQETVITTRKSIAHRESLSQRPEESTEDDSVLRAQSVLVSPYRQPEPVEAQRTQKKELSLAGSSKRSSHDNESPIKVFTKAAHAVTVERTTSEFRETNSLSTDSFAAKMPQSDDEDFDEDLKKLYEQNEKILVQTKALKRLGEQLLKEIEDM